MVPESKEVRRERIGRAIDAYDAEQDRVGSMGVLGRILPLALFVYALIGFCVWYF
jgi:hypothetical protein